jgi:selenocysteine lyase/cysteine desulfurase
MLQLLQSKLPALGFEPLTPVDSTSPIVSFSYKDAAKLKPRLEAAGISISLYKDRIRISPSIYNDTADMLKLINALS